jgi:hypothetical protein
MVLMRKVGTSVGNAFVFPLTPGVEGAGEPYGPGDGGTRVAREMELFICERNGRLDGPAAGESAKSGSGGLATWRRA